MASNRKRKAELIRDSIILLLVLLALLYGGSLYSRKVNERGLLIANFVSSSGQQSPAIKLEVAANSAERSKGLMFRKEMPRDRGMIFIFPEMGDQKIWMKNTYLSLDIIFLDSNLTIVGILEKVPVLNEAIRKVNKASKYVVELNAGVSSELKLEVGSKLVTGQPLPNAS